jgi:hypothetical protein
MKTLKATLILVWVLAVAAAETAAPDKQEPDWPKKLEAEEAQISIYQPQINSLDGDMLDARAALSIKKTGEKMVFGAMWFTSRLVTDFDTRLVSLKDVNIESVKFPDADEEGEAAMIDLLESEIPGMDMTFSLDRLLTSLKVAEQSSELSEKLNHTPPKIIFEDEAAVLVLIDGEPILEDIEDTRIQYVVNTPYFILYNKADGFFYLKGGDWWYRAGRVENTWRKIDNPPASISQIRPTEEDYQTDVDSIARTMKYPPKVILSKVPAELIITDGEPDFAALEGTDLLYVRNTESEILMDINTQKYFILIAGRWYKSRSLDGEGWEFVSPDELPEYFASIDTDSEMGSVRSSVPGTREAKEAILENEIPQTAEIDRKSASIEVEYDGNPQFERISGTKMSYAVNTDKSVLFIDNRYYAVDNGVWFVSDHTTGPWSVCVSVPDDVQSIPPASPVYNVKYVYVYDYTPDVVYVGYTPGYVYSYRYRGTIVYGTGYYYRPWYRTYYYPRPVTYGYGVHYNPYTGWGFSVGISYGWIGYTYYRRPYYYSSWWGPAGYCYGYRHGYYHGFGRSYYRGYYHGYSYGVYASSRSGYRAGYREGYHDGYHEGHHYAYSQNIYRSRPTGVIHTGTRATTYGSRTAANASRSSYSRPETADRKNNVYTDRSGNVYRKKGDTWQSREDGTWKKSDVTPRSRPSGSSTSTARTGETRTTAPTGTRTQSRTSTHRSSSDYRSSSTQRTSTQRTTSAGSSRSGQGSSYRHAPDTRSSGSTGHELRRESQARSQGSQRTYNYQKSQHQRQPAVSSSRSSTSRSSSATRSSSTSRSSSSKSSGTTGTSRTSKPTTRQPSRR